ncbi:MAG TPA: flavodoxin domain-containing protein [Acidimicrobiia bacterium]|nr:flavodoxin domain-containing protein [Acidimicrobiia bacterium]
MRVLVAFASKHGSTEEIAATVGSALWDDGFRADVRNVDTVTGLNGYGAVVLGSAVYAGSWMETALRFVRRHAQAMAPLPVWLFSSGPLGPVTDEHRRQPRELDYLHDLLLPEGHEVFSGRLDMERLEFPERMIMRAVHQTSADHRDWHAVRSWGKEIGFVLGHTHL